MNAVSGKTIIETQGFMAKTFPVQAVSAVLNTVFDDMAKISNNFAFDFHNAGYMKNYKIYTAKVIEDEEPATVLFEILETDVDSKYSNPDEKNKRWEYLKGSENISRKSKTDF